MVEVSWEMSMLSSVGVDSVFAFGGAPFDATVNLDTTGTLGCMDMAAENYDAGATLDDGSCFYVGDYCEFPDTAALGDNNVFLPVTIVYDDAGVPEDTLVSEKWFVYTAGATERGFLTATTCYAGRSEEHRELITHDLVCRLLLEKKKLQVTYSHTVCVTQDSSSS